MSKVITPMKRLKGQIDNLKMNLAEEYIYEAKDKREGRIDYASSYWGDREEPKVIPQIISDHIIFFNTKEKKYTETKLYKNYSFAISFDFFNKESNEQSIQLSYFNEEDNLIHSKPFPVEDFKEYIKDLNKALKQLSISTRAIAFEKVKEIVDNNPYDIKQDVIKAENEIESFLQNKKEEIGFNEAKLEADKNSSRFEKINNIINSTIESSEEYIELQAIEKRAKELKEKIEIERKSLQKSYNFRELREKKSKTDTILNMKSKEIEYEEKKAIQKQTSAIQNRIKLKRS
tara:strand:- start:2036 stop:2902 length:867 start_codon:yes stop_codon:yes gene_type:complete